MWCTNILLKKLETEHDVFVDVIIQLVIESFHWESFVIFVFQNKSSKSILKWKVEIKVLALC